MTDCTPQTERQAALRAALPYWFTPTKARRLINYGLAEWSSYRNKKFIVWREGNYFFRFSATTFRYLLEYRKVRERDWKPSYCRWS